MKDIENLKARAAGGLYLITILAGVFAQVGTRSALRVAESGSATAANIAAQTGLYRAGEVADLVMLICYVAVTVLLYEILAPAGRTLSRLAAGFSLTGIAVLAVAGIFHLAPLALLDGTVPALPIGVRDALIGLALDLHGTAYAISLEFFGAYCVLIGTLAIRSRRVPALVGGLMILGGASHLIAITTTILSPEAAQVLPGFMRYLPLIGEAALALWLLIAGLRRTA